MIYVLTNEKHYWLLRGFCHLFTTYWPDHPVTVAGYSPLDFDLPRGWDFYSIAPENWPAHRWSDGLIKLAQDTPYGYFILMLEDFWLNAPPNVEAISNLYEWMTTRRDMLRCELWGERAAKKQARFFGTISGVDLVTTPPHTKYQMSLQAAIWNRDLLLDVLRPGETPWQVEIDGSERLKDRPDLKVVGVRKRALHYQPVYQHGRLDVSKIPEKQVSVIRRRGWLA